MPTIDSDAHVIENSESWRFIDDPKLLPMIVRQESGSDRFNVEGKLKSTYWVLDGRVFERDQNLGSNTSLESREMHSVDSRIRHMDELEVDVQILYPTLL